ncbi:MAG: hypothetical protein ABIU05_06565 [Nitrospirales bacterium]
MPHSKEQQPDILGSFRPTRVGTPIPLPSFIDNDPDTAPSARYAEGECSSCHQLMPKNLLQIHSVSRVTGYASGATWTNAASSSTDSFGGNPPDFGGDLEVEFSRYFERGDSDEEEQIYGPADHVCAEAGGGRHGRA